MSVPTARLESWIYDSQRKIFWGYIYDDVRKRFRDGTYIHTSFCPSPQARGGDTISTLNSTYLLGKPFGEKNDSR